MSNNPLAELGKRAEEIQAAQQASKAAELPATEPEKPEETKPETATKTETAETITSIFGNVKIGDEAVEVKTVDEFFDVISKQAGKEIKSVNDVITYIKKSGDVPQSEYKVIKEQLDEYVLFLKTLPTDLSALVSDHYNKRDYRETMKQLMSPIDYSKPVSTYSEEAIIKMFNPEITDEDIEDMGEKEKKAIHKAARSLYEKEHETFKEKEQALKATKFDAAQKFLESVDRSITRLKKDMPNLTEKQVETVKQHMLTGYTLYDNNVYKEDAAVKIAYAEFATDEFQRIVDEAGKNYQKRLEQEISKTKEEMLAERTNDKLETGKTGTPSEDKNKKIKEMFPFL